ncbi:TatD family hydrolase [Candidatus Kinetoplastidibacterium desouzai]|nr:TatD family hydrolase [Candidatus Kinetoplastibacterium desouzaii]
MFIDSHCHLNLPELSDKIESILEKMINSKVYSALIAGVNKKDFSDLLKLVSQYDNLWGSVGMHPECIDEEEYSIEDLCSLAKHTKIVAIGETGLDYYRSATQDLVDLQKERFRKHIIAAKLSKVPLIIHTRSSALETLKILKEERANEVGGVIHCFSENWNIAKLAMDLNFFISMSGVVTFKNAKNIQEVAKKIPLDKLLIETDSPYLSPEPYRGKINDPSNVIYIAKKIAELRDISETEVAESSSKNFYSLFTKANKRMVS